VRLPLRAIDGRDVGASNGVFRRGAGSCKCGGAGKGVW
jgi:hypothetical protein